MTEINSSDTVSEGQVPRGPNTMGLRSAPPSGNATCPDCLKPLADCTCAANRKRQLKLKSGRRIPGDYIPPELRADTVECPTCRGAGYVLRRNERFEQQITECGRCAGAGRITKS